MPLEKTQQTAVEELKEAEGTTTGQPDETVYIAGSWFGDADAWHSECILYTPHLQHHFVKSKRGAPAQAGWLRNPGPVIGKKVPRRYINPCVFSQSYKRGRGHQTSQKPNRNMYGSIVSGYWSRRGG